MVNKKKNMMYVSNDLGYGAIKGDFDGVSVKQPSVYTKIFSKPSWENIDLTDNSAVENAVKDILENLDVSINDERFLIGNAAIASLKGTVDLQTDSPAGKANGKAAMILPQAYIAGRAIQEAYGREGSDFVVGNPLQVNVTLVTALPISESVGENGEDIRPKYVERFTQKTHNVIVHSLGEDIVVGIKFQNVIVLKEGQIAVNSVIKHGDATLSKKLIEEVKKNYPDKAKIADTLILDSQNYVSIDIGQGTTDMALISDSAVNDASYSINQGFGDILEDTFNQFHHPMITKMESFIKVWNGDTDLGDVAEKIDLQIQKNSEALQTEIISGLTFLFRKTPTVQVIFVFGGGSVPMVERYHLLERIKDRVNSLQSSAVVVWVGKEKAQTMNEEALKKISDYLKSQEK